MELPNLEELRMSGGALRGGDEYIFGDVVGPALRCTPPGAQSAAHSDVPLLRPVVLRRYRFYTEQELQAMPVLA